MLANINFFWLLRIQGRHIARILNTIGAIDILIDMIEYYGAGYWIRAKHANTIDNMTYFCFLSKLYFTFTALYILDMIDLWTNRFRLNTILFCKCEVGPRTSFCRRNIEMFAEADKQIRHRKCFLHHKGIEWKLPLN